MDALSLRLPPVVGLIPVNSENDDRAAFMNSSQLFASLSISERCQIAKLARRRTFLRNDVLFAQGHPFRLLILVQSGCVKLTHLCANGTEVILALRGKGDAIALPAGSPFCDHASGAQVVTNCTALTWTSPTVEFLMTSIPRLGVNVSSILNNRMNDLEERYHALCVDKVERRVASLLIYLTERFGTPSAGGLELAISRQELAQMTGTTIFTVSRLISKWGGLGLVVPKREAILMLDPARLNLLSDVDQDPLENQLPPLLKQGEIRFAVKLQIKPKLPPMEMAYKCKKNLGLASL